MGEKAKDELADGEGLEALEERLRWWREGRKKGDRIPEPLWEAAVVLGREHGATRVASRLRLNAVFLRKRMEGAAGPRAPAGTADPEFVELFAAPTGVSVAAKAVIVRECVIELENARGAKMRVELNGAGLAGLAHLCRGFWGAT